MKTPERHQANISYPLIGARTYLCITGDNKYYFWRRSGVFIVNFEYISYLALVFQLLTLNMQLPVRTMDI